MTDLDNLPVACTLTTPELREHEETVLAQFRSGVVETGELKDGYAFRLSGDVDSVRLVADLITAERACCRFLKFELVAQPNMGSVEVRVTGPAGTKEFLSSLLGLPPTPGGPNEASQSHE
jgi:hypothetical protein